VEELNGALRTAVDDGAVVVVVDDVADDGKEVRDGGAMLD
jgi:hypothetical protein